MIVNKYIAEEIDRSVFPDAPDPNSGVLRKYKADGITFFFCKRPASCGLAPIDRIVYSLVAFSSEDEYIFAASVVESDLRELSNLANIPLRQLQEEMGVKGFYTAPRLVLYGSGRREDLGLYPNEVSDLMVDDLFEYALDSLDILSDPEEIDG